MTYIYLIMLDLKLEKWLNTESNYINYNEIGDIDFSYHYLSYFNLNNCEKLLIYEDNDTDIKSGYCVNMEGTNHKSRTSDLYKNKEIIIPEYINRHNSNYLYKRIVEYMNKLNDTIPIIINNKELNKIEYSQMKLCNIPKKKKIYKFLYDNLYT